MGEDRTPPVRRTTVAEAAQVLGISAEAVRGRIRRGTLPVEREGGTVYVLIENPSDYRTTTDQPRTTAEHTPDRTDALIAELQDRVRSLEEANRENRRIIAALTSRIPELPPPEPSKSSRTDAEDRIEPTPSEPTEPGRVGPREEPLTAEAPQSTWERLREEPERADTRSSGQAAQEPAERRSLWQRLFGG